MVQTWCHLFVEKHSCGRYDQGDLNSPEQKPHDDDELAFHHPSRDTALLQHKFIRWFVMYFI
jgi:hypothetical protein